MALQFDDNDTPKFNDSARNMKIDTLEKAKMRLVFLIIGLTFIKVNLYLIQY